jgi:molecular chaperone GrpE
MDEARDTRRPPGHGEPSFRVVDRRPRLDDAGGGADAAPVPRHPTYVEELQERVQEAERRAEEAERRARELSAAYRRVDEERDAFRERLSRDLERRVDAARAGLMRKVVEIVDDFERALQAARAAGDSSPLFEGVALTRDRLVQVLAAEGVEPFDTAGRPFDPEVAEAIATEETEDPQRDGIVVAEECRGYTLRGTLLRPARVRVARARVASD